MVNRDMEEAAPERDTELRVFDLMRQPVEMIDPDQSVRAAAFQMAKRGIGFLPVCEDERAIGVLTDRDITVRVVAAGLDTETTRVRKVMTRRVFGCPSNASLWEAGRLMRASGVRRLVVTDSATYMVIGVISMADLDPMPSHARSAPSEEHLGQGRDRDTEH